MYKRQREAKGVKNLVPFNPEIDATVQCERTAARTAKEAIVVMAEGNNRVLRDYALPQASGISSSIVSPVIGAINFKLNLAFIIFMERNQFGGHPSTTPTRIFTNLL